MTKKKKDKKKMPVALKRFLKKYERFPKKGELAQFKSACKRSLAKRVGGKKKKGGKKKHHKSQSKRSHCSRRGRRGLIFG